MNIFKKAKKGYTSVKKMYKKVVRKSRAGVKYTHYVSFFTGTPNQGLNRAGRRLQVKLQMRAITKERLARRILSGQY